MKIAVFSDIHGNYQALEAIINHISKQNVDKIIFLGDAVSLGPNHNECINLLNSIDDLIYIYGNHELYCTRGYKIDSDMKKEEHKLVHHLWVKNTIEMRNLSNEMLSYEICVLGKKMLFSHFLLKEGDYPFYQLDLFKENKYHFLVSKLPYDYIFIGHYHDGLVDEIDNKKLYCVGSSGCVKDDNTFYHIIECNDDIKINKILVPFDRYSFVNNINSLDYPGIEDIKIKFFGMK